MGTTVPEARSMPVSAESWGYCAYVSGQKAPWGVRKSLSRIRQTCPLKPLDLGIQLWPTVEIADRRQDTGLGPMALS